MPEEPRAYALRSQTEENVKVPTRPAVKCTGFSYLDIGLESPPHGSQNDKNR